MAATPRAATEVVTCCPLTLVVTCCPLVRRELQECGATSGAAFSARDGFTIADVPTGFDVLDRSMDERKTPGSSCTELGPLEVPTPELPWATTGRSGLRLQWRDQVC